MSVYRETHYRQDWGGRKGGRLQLHFPLSVLVKESNVPEDPWSHDFIYSLNNLSTRSSTSHNFIYSLNNKFNVTFMPTLQRRENRVKRVNS